MRSTGSEKIKVLNKLFTSLKKTLCETIGRVLHVDLQEPEYNGAVNNHDIVVPKLK